MQGLKTSVGLRIESDNATLFHFGYNNFNLLLYYVEKNKIIV